MLHFTQYFIINSCSSILIQFVQDILFLYINVVKKFISYEEYYTYRGKI